MQTFVGSLGVLTDCGPVFCGTQQDNYAKLCNIDLHMVTDTTYFCLIGSFLIIVKNRVNFEKVEQKSVWSRINSDNVRVAPQLRLALLCGSSGEGQTKICQPFFFEPKVRGKG